jgi:UDP-N-acetylglucosamine--N-acetylmuramyl-(pentapeptide) pyrophosphoryl-undecaprenol N-acetylglucosamine transferase
VSRFLISCGGTGGHLSPGIALAEKLHERGHDAVLLVSRKKVDARLLEKYPQLSFLPIPGAPFTLQPVGFARFVATQTRGFFYSVSLVRRRKPDGIIGFGGFTTASVIVAAALFKVPVALHEANRVPGRAIRLLGRLAQRVYLPPGVALPDVPAAAIRSFGLPVRPEIHREPRDAARQVFGLDPAQQVLVVLGGSQGATPLNAWARTQAETLAGDGVQVYCVTGLGKGEPEVKQFTASNGRSVKAIFSPFCDRMGTLMSAADLVVSRAGAGTIAELVRCEAPAILIPYPQAADNHQQANADYFAEKGGGRVLGQEHLDELTNHVRELILNSELLEAFRAQLRAMDQPLLLDEMLGDLEALIDQRKELPPPPVVPKAA